VKNQPSNSPIKFTIRLSALALLALMSISLVSCDDETQSGVDLSQEERNRELKNRKSEAESPPAPSVQPIDPFYGDRHGGSFYGH
jgi:hypothetical protein